MVNHVRLRILLREQLMNAGVLSYWGMWAEYLGRSLGTYTPFPSNRSSTGALQPEGTEVSF